MTHPEPCPSFFFLLFSSFLFFFGHPNAAALTCEDIFLQCVPKHSISVKKQSLRSCHKLEQQCDLKNTLIYFGSSTERLREKRITGNTMQEELLFQLLWNRKGMQKGLHGSEKIRVCGHSWSALICFRLHSARGDSGPRFLSSY